MTMTSFPTNRGEALPGAAAILGYRKGLSVYERGALSNERIFIPPSSRTRVNQSLNSANHGITGMTMDTRDARTRRQGKLLYL